MGYDSKGILVFNLKYEHAITGTCGQDPMMPALFFLFFLDVAPPPFSSPINSTIDCSPKFSPQVAMLLLTIQLFRYIMFQEMDPVFFMH